MTVECLLTYDVNTQTADGERRLRRVAKVCEGLGDRVQKSVFEVRCSAAQLITLIHALDEIVTEQDSIRIYRVEVNQLAAVQTLGRPTEHFVRGSRTF